MHALHGAVSQSTVSKLNYVVVAVVLPASNERTNERMKQWGNWCQSACAVQLCLLVSESINQLSWSTE